MALTIRPCILGQQITGLSYSYLFEPFRINVTDSDTTAKVVYVDIALLSQTGTIIKTIQKIGSYNMNEGDPVFIDLTRLAQQVCNFDVYKYGNVTDILSYGWKSSVLDTRFTFEIYTSVSGTKTSIRKMFIMGGREFLDFVPTVLYNGATTEAELYGVDLKRWKGFPVLTTVLKDPSQTDSTPTITQTIPTEGKYPCGGYLLWKSRLGGWMNWGFDISNENPSKTYEGDLEPPMFESTLDYDGNPFVPVNYTGINNSRTLSLKALNLQNIELRAVSGITYSPAVYYVKENGDLELMRLSSSSAPLSNLASGGDFSVTLQSISRTFNSTL